MNNKEFNKVRWYHIPKSGGTSIFNMTQHWNNFKRAHPNKNHVKTAFYPPNNDEIGLTVIRHPYERFVSAFYHMVDACNSNFYYRNAKVSDCNTMKKRNINFDIFQNDPNIFLYALITNTHPHHKIAKEVFNTFTIFKPQFYWVSDMNGHKIHESIKIILNQENLEREFEEIADKLGHHTSWPNEKMSNKRITTDKKELNDLSKSIIRNIYKDDFIHFDFYY